MQALVMERSKARRLRIASHAARFGGLLSLGWGDITETELWFMETENGRRGRCPLVRPLAPF